MVLLVRQTINSIDYRSGGNMVAEYKSMVQTGAYERLTTLAKNPYDLTETNALLTDDRLARLVCRSRLVSLHYGTQRIDSEAVEALQDLADELALVEQFKSMRRGDVLNKIDGFECENRKVLHTACRDIFTDSPREPGATASALDELSKLKQFLTDLDTGKIAGPDGRLFETIVHVGIGGSDLGPRAIYEALAAFGTKNRKIKFISNVDPDDATRALAGVDLSTALVNIVSKSGTTLETLTNEKLVVRQFEKAGLVAKQHCIAVTGQGSPMDNPEKYLRSFYMFDYIGGRYSSTSMVGAVSLGFFLGYDQLIAFLKGASTIDGMAELKDIKENIPLLLALLGVWNHSFLGYPTLAVLPYSQALNRFPAHLQQCDMESNGKSVQRNGELVDWKTGPVIWGEPGTNGQHAFYQLLHQGTEIVPVEFIGFRKSQYEVDIAVKGSSSQEKLLANLYAQMVALATGQGSLNPNKRFPGNRPSSLIFAEQLNPEVMGALLALYEAKIAFQGFSWNINSFDQEGVQLGKVLATRFLNEIGGQCEGGDGLENYFLKQL